MFGRGTASLALCLGLAAAFTTPPRATISGRRFAAGQGGFGDSGGGARAVKFAYDQRTLSRANDNFAKLAQLLKAPEGEMFGQGRQRMSYEEVCEGRTASVADLYVRGPGSPKMWFVGKCAAGAGFPKGAVGGAWAQRALIFEHARRLRPQELGFPGKERELELFCATGNSELAVVQDEERLYRCDAALVAGLALPQSWAEVVQAHKGESCPLGFQPEYYEEGEAGFYTVKGADGESLGEPVKINIQAAPEKP